MAPTKRGRATHLSRPTDGEALAAVSQVTRTEGILVALETAHAFAKLAEIARRESERRGRPGPGSVCLVGAGTRISERCSSSLEKLS